MKLRGQQFLFALLGALIVVACYAVEPNRPVSDDDAAPSVQALTEGVTGRVLSASSHHPVVGAAVTAKSLDDLPLAIPELGIDTDQEGRYEWPLGAGRYAVTVLAKGYEPATQEVRFGRGELVTLNFLLQGIE